MIKERLKQISAVIVYVYDYICDLCKNKRILLTDQEEVSEQYDSMCCPGNHIRRVVGPPQFIKDGKYASI